ncbi:MAG: hypothetical protein N2Z20_00255 [Elusimicrobiales bacterium]|nr:hypothetical protein [Elusimicrobiales bacterium]
MPLSKKIILNQKVNIVIFTPKPYIFDLDTNTKNIIIKEINISQENLRSKIDIASSILNESGINPYQTNQKTLYIETKLKNFNEMIDYLKNWKFKPQIFFNLLKIFFKFDSNIHPFDKLILLVELLKINSKNILHVKISFSDTLPSQGQDNSIVPFVSIISLNSKQKIVKNICELLKKNKIDVIEEKKIYKKSLSTHIVVKNNNKLELAKKLILILNQKQEIPIKINPKIIYDAEIYIGDDFKSGG